MKTPALACEPEATRLDEAVEETTHCPEVAAWILKVP